MSQSNRDIIDGIYAAFARGDIPAVLGAMAPDIVWNEAEHNLPLAEGNPYVGPQAVLEGVFMRLGEEFDGFAVVPVRLVAEGDCVVMCGRYSATARATGRPLNPQAVHVWTLRDGKVTGFQQHVDTLGLAIATGRVAL
ncbi:MAG TPA: nuclear transport factor 2 family protein [Thermomonas sp.]|nr:nuclear transport factor 2 family protein [Thermomonas sp.]